METKDGLTRDEVREAIGILALREDNLDIITIGVGSIIAAFFLVAITIIFSSGTYQHLSNLSGLALDYLSEILVVLIISLIFFFILLSRSSNIYETANKLAKDYNLEKFFHATLGKKVVFELINKMMKK